MFPRNVHLDYLESVNNLSRRHVGLTGKNPSVACLIVDYSNSSQGHVLSYGLTSIGGSPHAEVNALNKIQKNKITKKTIMYLSLEPCFKDKDCCAKKILNMGIRKVYLSSLDPNPLIYGKGLNYLKKNNVKVEFPLKKINKFKLINKFFYKYHFSKRPYLTLKLAISKNGFSKNFHSYNITSPQTQYYMHKYRLSHDAIGVGYNTYKDDKPKLNCRLNGINKRSLKFIISNQNRKIKKFHSIKLDLKEDINNFFQQLQSFQINSILIEGGAKTFNYFYKNNAFDELIICRSTKIVKFSNNRYKINLNLLKSNLKLYSSRSYEDDIIEIYKK